jgi:hypothetical protein
MVAGPPPLHLHHEVMLAAVPNRGIGERRLRFSRKFHKLLQRSYGNGWIDREHHLRVDQRGDRRQVLQRVERHLRVEVRADDDLRVGAQEQGVAVGRRARSGFHRHVAVGAGAVVDHDRLAERLAQLRREDARERVGRPAGRVGDQQPDRARRVVGCVLRLR